MTTRWGLLLLVAAVLAPVALYAKNDTDGNLLTALGALLAGERNPSSLTNSYLVNRPEVNGTVVSAGTGVKTLSAGPAHFAGVWIHTALAGTLTIACLTDESGVAGNWVLPIGTVGLVPAPFMRCETALTAQKSSATDDGRIVLFWRPL